MIENIINNWYLIAVLIVVLICGFLGMQKWLRLPKHEQVRNIKQWLLLAVVTAEKELGGGTGQLKLRFVYDWALERFKWLAFIPFAMFSGWVDEALDEMKKMLENKKIKEFVAGE